jgi:hypothetical protein
MTFSLLHGILIAGKGEKGLEFLSKRWKGWFKENFKKKINRLTDDEVMKNRIS